MVDKLAVAFTSQFTPLDMKEHCPSNWNRLTSISCDLGLTPAAPSKDSYILLLSCTAPMAPRYIALLCLLGNAGSCQNLSSVSLAVSHRDVLLLIVSERSGCLPKS